MLHRIAFGSGFRDYQGAKPGVEGPWLAPLITGVVLVIITAYMAYTAPADAPLLYWAVTIYPFATGLVEFARVNFDASRYGFLTATWHNLPEYIILMYLFMTKERAGKVIGNISLLESRSTCMSCSLCICGLCASRLCTATCQCRKSTARRRVTAVGRTCTAQCTGATVMIHLPSYVLSLSSVIHPGFGFTHGCVWCALQALPWVLLWVWFLNVFIMFVPAIGNWQLRGPVYGGLLEQITGICCDHLLLYVFGYLWYTEKDAELKHAYGLGGIAAFMHMLEIVPLGEYFASLLHTVLPMPWKKGE